MLGGIVREPAPDLSSVSLPDDTQADEPLAMVAPDGEFLIMYFGYTACPDICPTTMSDLRTALENLDEGERDRTEVATATVRPSRDSGQLLTSLVPSFHPEAHALRTDDLTLLRTVTDAFGADFQVSTASDGTVDVAHTTWLYAIDDQGLLRVQWSFGTSGEDIARDMEILLAGDAGGPGQA